MEQYDDGGPAHDGSVWKGFLAGAIGGLAGAWTMNQFQTGVSKARQQILGERPAEKSDEGDDATVKTAEAISCAVTDHQLTRREKKTAGPTVHYAFGALMGGLYGAAVERYPRGRVCWGTAFGGGLWAGADEVAVPALGLSNPPWKTPASTHLSALTAHLVYGASVETVRRGLRRVM